MTSQPNYILIIKRTLAREINTDRQSGREIVIKKHPKSIENKREEEIKQNVTKNHKNLVI